MPPRGSALPYPIRRLCSRTSSTGAMGPYHRLKIVVSGIGKVPAKASSTPTGMTRDCWTAKVLAMRAGYRDSPGAARPVISGRSKKRLDARRGRAGRRNGVDAVRRGRHDPGIALQPGFHAFRLPALDRDEGVRVSADLDFVALPGRPERPRRIEVFLTHQPVDRDPDDHGVADQRLPVEAPPGHLARLDHPDRRVDRPGRHRHLLR